MSAIGEAMAKPRLTHRPFYVVVRRPVGHVDDVIDPAHFLEEYREPTEGEGVYVINTDGSLRLLKHEWDASV
jgi:nucleoside-diphosphate-sugar epimerase